MTQSQRVLRRLQAVGSVNPADFQAPTCDGGKPILRVAARVLELKDRGWRIEARHEKNRTVTYVLAAEQALEDPSRGDSPDQSSGEGGEITAASAPAESLFDVGPSNGYEVAA